MLGHQRLEEIIDPLIGVRGHIFLFYHISQMTSALIPIFQLHLHLQITLLLLILLLVNVFLVDKVLPAQSS